MKFENRLQQLILQYNIDSCVPKYRFFLHASRILEKRFKKLHKVYKHIVLIGTHETDIKWVQCCICDNCAEEYIIDSELKLTLKSDEDHFYWIVSGDENEVIFRLASEAEIRFESIYDVLQMYHNPLKANFYDVYDEVYYCFRNGRESRDWRDFDINRLFYLHRVAFENENEIELKKQFLQQIIFDCVYARDFLTLKEYIAVYIDLYGKEAAESYIQFYNAVEILLDDMKMEFHRRGKKDLIMIWLDALEYGEDQVMPFLMSLDDIAIVCDNAYTVTPYTGATFKTLFAKQRVIEEKSFRTTKVDYSNSPLLRKLAARNYQFKYYGELNLAGPEFCPHKYYTIYTSITQIYWDIVCDLLENESDKAQFCVLHEVLQTHIPYISLGVRDKEYSGCEEWPGQQDGKEKILRNKQVIPSRLYVDRQLQFWDAILPPNMYKLYMSDHGHTEFGRFHTIFKIQQEDLCPQRYQQLVSYYDFDQLILNVLDFGKIQEENLKTYVFVEDVDYYNKDYILDVVQKNDFYERGLVSYRGIITDKDMLIEYRNGMSYYLKNENDGVMVSDERLYYLHSKMKTQFIDIKNEDKFKYSRMIWNGYTRCKERTDEEVRRKQELIKACFSLDQDDLCLAIRGGGIHTLQILMLLDERERCKIDYIIDNDPNCIAGRYGIKVICMDQLQDMKIDKIVISSFDYRYIWKSELSKCFHGEIIDPYDYFQEQGIVCTKEFYKMNYIATDFANEDE